MKKLIIAIMMVMTIGMAAFADSYKLLGKCGDTKEFISNVTGLTNPVMIKGEKTKSIQTDGKLKSYTFVCVHDDNKVEILSVYNGKPIVAGIYVEGDKD